MTEIELKAKEIYDAMKGFRIKNSHRKKCALVCIEQMKQSLSLVTDGNDNNYWIAIQRLNEIEAIINNF